MDRSITQRIDQLNWRQIRTHLDAEGFALTGPLLIHEESDALRTLYPNDAVFRSHIRMARHGFGQGEYKYFGYPLPDPIPAIRTAVYRHLVPVANRWQEVLGNERRFPLELDAMLAQCHQAGQTRPTPLLLQYGPGDYNCLHQDLYGDQVFPIQLAILLSQPGDEFEGGEFVLTEQRPRMQSKAEVVPLKKGYGVLFAVNQRPKQGARGTYRVTMRHGVSTVRKGARHTAGILFHDAR